MQTTYFRAAAERTVHVAYPNDYETGACHPDRVMTQHDFVYIVQGEWEVWQDGVSCFVQRGDVLLLTAGAHHWGETPCQDGTKTLFIHTAAFPEERVCAAPDGALTGLPVSAVTHCGEHPEVMRQFCAIIEAFATEEPFREQRISVMMSALLFLLYDIGRTAESGGELLRTVNRLMADDPRAFFSNRALADAAFLCEKTFVRRFREQTGITPHQYQLRHKLRLVRAMLTAYPQMTLREMAYRFGFYDEFHLSKSFRRVYGISPASYRASVSRSPADAP